ncbi:MAG TPA: hypothetical protein VGV60_18320 [Candidatus Polarisedimenticolia bacterium]|jgi:hypothetical protein|nr:hypothetical protein [Candidatus Polarisedimenticolia bacterium]
MEDLRLDIEQLEERIAPDMAPGLLGYEGQPGNQGDGGSNGNPSGSANPEVPAGATPQPNP